MSQQSSVELYKQIVGSSVAFDVKEDKIQGLLNSKDTIERVNLATIYFEFSKWYWSKKKDKQKALSYALLTNEILSQNTTLSPDIRKRNLYNLATFYKLQEFPDLPNALFYLDELISISDPLAPRVGKAYKQKGDIYDKLGDFQKALENYSIAESIHKKNKDFKGLRTTYINTSAVLAKLEDSTYADSFYSNERKLDTLREASLISTSQEMKLLINKGVIEAATGHYQRSLNTYGQALELANKLEDSVYIFTVLNNIGATYLKMEDLEAAESFQQRSSAYSGNNIYFNSALATNLADLYLKNKQFNKALSSHNEALNFLLEEPIIGHETLPAFSVIEVSPFKRDILDLLIEKASVWREYYRETSNKAHLNAGLETILLADKVVDLLFVESREQLSKLFWRKKGSQLYLTAVSICYELEDMDNALYFMEKNRGLLLLQNITQASAWRFGGVPPDIIDQEVALIGNLKKLELELAAVPKDKNTAQSDSLRSKIFITKDKLEAFIKQLEQDYPAYFELKRGVPISDSKTIQNTLEDTDHVVEYAFGDKEGYVLWISKEGMQLKRLDAIINIKKDINLFRSLVSKPLVTPDQWEAYREVGFRLFKSIVPFKELQNSKEFFDLTVVPDGLLQYIPFEALITSTGSTSQDYLLHKAELHYEYSMSLRIERRSLETVNKRGFVGFAMDSFKDDYVPTLLYSDLEKSTISPYFGSSLFKAEEATKEHFLSAYNDNAVIHISSHGGVTSGTPWIAFYDTKLLLDELYFIKSTKELVVLSACKTSFGNIREGEGVFSLTRGFINSGTKSVLASLWDINERSSSEIVGNFYKQLKKGDNKASALHQAKTEYVSTYANTSQESPFYWSSMILTGDTSAIKPSRHWPLLLGALLLLLLISVILLRRKKRTASSLD